MLKVRSTQDFMWRHDSKEEYCFENNEAISMTEEAFAHIIKVFGSDMFVLVEDNKPIKPKKEKDAS